MGLKRILCVFDNHPAVTKCGPELVCTSETDRQALGVQKRKLRADSSLVVDCENRGWI